MVGCISALFKKRNGLSFRLWNAVSDMTLPAQISVGFEISKPIYGLAKVIGCSVLEVVRHFHDSGSDIFIENDLAEVLGSNMIEERMSSAFRQAVHVPADKSILSKALDLVVEGGAGPTVQYALLSEVHFRSLIQLSLLAWTHDPGDFSVALSRAVESCVERDPSSTSHKLLNASDLKGTLKACRDQTASFPWNHLFHAVEAKLGISVTNRNDPYSAQDHRSLSYSLLEAMVFMLPKVQRAPEEYRLVIQTSRAVSLIVVWAHHVLGLDVKVIMQDATHCFGSERDCIKIEYLTINKDRGAFPLRDSLASLYTAISGDVHFQIGSSDGFDMHLQPGIWQPLEGYGGALLGHEFDHDNTINQIGELVTALSMAMIHNKQEEQQQEKENTHINSVVPDKELPSEWRVLEIGNILFDRNLSSSKIQNMSQELYNYIKRDKYIAWFDEALQKLDTELYQTLKKIWDKYRLIDPRIQSRSLLQTIAFLSRLILVFCNVANIHHCRHVALNLETGIKSYDLSFDVPPASESFNIIAKMMNGNESLADDLSSLVALSSCGWTLYVASISLQSPAAISRDIYLQAGTLARSGVRKEYIKDGLSGSAQIWHDSSERHGAVPDSESTIIASSAGIIAEPDCYAQDVHRARGLVTSSDRFFGVLYEFSCFFRNHSAGGPSSVTLGYRRMQEMAWSIDRTPGCTHGSEYPGKATLPEKAVTFTGWRSPFKIPSALSNQPRNDSDPDLCILLISGHRNARWVYLYRTVGSRRRYIFLRRDDTCFQCAVDYTIKQMPGKLKILVL